MRLTAMYLLGAAALLLTACGGGAAGTSGSPDGGLTGDDVGGASLDGGGLPGRDVVSPPDQTALDAVLPDIPPIDAPDGGPEDAGPGDTAPGDIDRDGSDPADVEDDPDIVAPRDIVPDLPSPEDAPDDSAVEDVEPDVPCECQADEDCAAEAPLCQQYRCTGCRCELQPAADGSACVPEDACSVGDTCQGGVCGEALVCDDGDACNGLETCDPANGCVDGEAPICDDDDLCNGVETCDPEIGCVDGEPLTCTDWNVCNGVETCDPQSGCQPGEPPQCDDDDVCNGIEYCDVDLGCVEGEPLTCTDWNVCNGVETCDPQLGCLEGTPPACDDGDVCNGIETCDIDLGCVPGTPLECVDDDPCNGDESCSPTQGCQPGEYLDCGDGDMCNGVEWCEPGVGCQPGVALSCSNDEPCDGAEWCDPADGCQPGEPLVCDDGDPCNGSEWCQAWEGCRNDGLTLECADDDPCTDDACVAMQGCVFTPNVAPCDDGDACTTGDTCSEGTCVGGAWACACEDDALEWDDDRASASPLPEDGEVLATACPGSPDYFAREVLTGRRMEVTLTYVIDGAGPALAIEDDRGVTLAVGVPTQTGQVATLDAPQDAVYYVRVSADDPAWGLPYTLSAAVSASPCQDDAYEENDSSLTPTLLAAGIDLDGRLCHGDPDWFAVQTGAGQLISATIEMQPTAAPITYFILDPTFASLATVTNSGGAVIEAVTTLSGPHYITFGGSLGVMSDYQLSVTLSVPPRDVDWGVTCDRESSCGSDAEPPPARVGYYAGDDVVLRGRVFEPGVTDQGVSPAPGLVAQAGYGPRGTNPAASPDWLWFPAAPDPDWDNAGELTDAFVATLSAPPFGLWDMAYRFSIETDRWLYCDTFQPWGDVGWEQEQSAWLAVWPTCPADDDDRGDDDPNDAWDLARGAHAEGVLCGPSDRDWHRVVILPSVTAVFTLEYEPTDLCPIGSDPISLTVWPDGAQGSPLGATSGPGHVTIGNPTGNAIVLLLEVSTSECPGGTYTVSYTTGG